MSHASSITVRTPKRGGFFYENITMSKAKKRSLTGSDQQPVKSEYDGEEADVVKGEKIKVKSARAAGGGGAHANGSKAQSFIKGGSEYLCYSMYSCFMSNDSKLADLCIVVCVCLCNHR